MVVLSVILLSPSWWSTTLHSNPAPLFGADGSTNKYFRALLDGFTKGMPKIVMLDTPYAHNLFYTHVHTF